MSALTRRHVLAGAAATVAAAALPAETVAEEPMLITRSWPELLAALDLPPDIPDPLLRGSVGTIVEMSDRMIDEIIAACEAAEADPDHPYVLANIPEIE